ncbi:MAG: GatB/YqeY domain-containing protein [bacterium]|nr:GatB/YqeY domain-containing protein [bacterium]
MSIQSNIREQVVVAMKARDTMRLNVLRGLLAAFTNEAVAKKRKPDEELSDEEALAVISRAVKQRKDSIEQFEKGNRKDLAEAEQAELKILETYLPAQMSREEVFEYVKQKVSEAGGVDNSKKGQFMGGIMKDLKGKVDGVLVKEVIDTELVS